MIIQTLFEGRIVANDNVAPPKDFIATFVNRSETLRLTVPFAFNRKIGFEASAARAFPCGALDYGPWELILIDMNPEDKAA